MFCFCIFQLYNFGETVSIVFWTDTWRPDSFYDKIKRNKDRGMHTLCLLGSFYMTFNSFTQKNRFAVLYMGMAIPFIFVCRGHTS